jgi:hypothetical protein
LGEVTAILVNDYKNIAFFANSDLDSFFVVILKFLIISEKKKINTREGLVQHWVL